MKHFFRSMTMILIALLFSLSLFLGSTVMEFRKLAKWIARPILFRDYVISLQCR